MAYLTFFLIVRLYLIHIDLLIFYNRRQEGNLLISRNNYADIHNHLHSKPFKNPNKDTCLLIANFLYCFYCTIYNIRCTCLIFILRKYIGGIHNEFSKTKT